MKKIFFIFLAFSFTLSNTVAAAPKKRRATISKSRRSAPAKTVRRSSRSSTSPSYLKSQLSQALRMAQSGQYLNAANALFSLSRRSELQADRPQIKYILGLMLMELKLNQVAAFQFVDVIRMNNPKYTKQAIEKLSIVADTLGDDTILNYAISRVNVNDFPANRRDMIYFRLGEIKMKGHEYSKASDLFSRVPQGSSYYYQAAFNKGLSELEGKQTDMALATFQRMLESRQGVSVTDTNKVASQMAIARTLYQKQDFEGAIEAYSQIPRDTLMWHDAVFEQAWAMLRAARFRSALSNFQTLHSAYYEDFYMPESLLLRAIVYLYICKYDEMEKVLGLFEKTYGPIRRQITEFMHSGSDATAYYNEIEKANAMKRTDKSMNLRLPYIVSRNVLEEGDVKRALNYLHKLSDERDRVEGNSAFRATPLGQYALKILINRAKNSKIAVGEMVKVHLNNMRAELKDLYEQAGFIRYEMINGKKEVIKKKISNKDVSSEQIDDRIDRKFYIQNGFEYYPFQGEYWLDEIGNYHYLGKQSCE